MVEKVKVSREVVEAIKILREQGESDATIIQHTIGRRNTHEKINVLSDFIFNDALVLQEQRFELLMDALRKGYEVEQTPEEKLLERYEAWEHIRLTSNHSRDSMNGMITGALTTLDILGIKIKGVNE